MADGMKETLQDLIQTIEEEASHAGNVTNMIDQISKSISKVWQLSIHRNFGSEFLSCQVTSKTDISLPHFRLKKEFN